MIKLVVIISLGSALFWLKGGTATRQGPISESSENILRGARFKVYGFEVKIYHTLLNPSIFCVAQNKRTIKAI